MRENTREQLHPPPNNPFEELVQLCSRRLGPDTETEPRRVMHSTESTVFGGSGLTPPLDMFSNMTATQDAELFLKERTNVLAKTDLFLETLNKAFQNCFSSTTKETECSSKNSTTSNSKSKYRLSDGRHEYSSSYRGVYWNKSSGTWRARIWIHGKSQHIGNYETEIEAAKAYDQRALLIGRYKTLNFQD